MKETVHSYTALLLIFFFGFLFLSAPPVRAATYYFCAGTGNWNNVGNWKSDAGCSIAGSIPGPSDDAIIVGDNVLSNSGSPASVNTLTVNSTFATNISITVASGAVFNDTSFNSGTITGNTTFNNSSFNIDTISGNATFNDSSYNQGIISGDAVFNYASGGIITLTSNQKWGTVSGTVKGNDAVLITAFIFNDSSNVSPGGTVPDDATFNNLSFNAGTVSGNATFNDSSYNQGIISGDAVFNYASGGTIFLSGSQVWGTVTGTVKGNDAVSLTEFIFNDTSFNNANIPGNATFNDSSYNDSTVSGNAIFNDLSYTDVGSTVTGDAIFNVSSLNKGTISGNATFSGNSINFTGTVSLDATFSDTSANYSIVLGNATFNNDADGNFGPVSGNATFNANSYNSGTISGTATFNDTSFNNVGSVATGVFNDSSSNSAFANVSGNASFLDSSVNSGNVTGNACFATTANQDGGSVGGTITACSVLAPTVTTDSATILSTSSAQLFGTITDTGGESANSVGFEYGRTITYGTTVSQTGIFVHETFDITVSSLSCGNYHFRAFATNGAGTSYGSDLVFSTANCGGGTIYPAVSLFVNPGTIQSGQSSTLTWSSSNANSCSASWSGSSATSGSQAVTPVATTTYTIACTSNTGQSANDSATVNVNQAQNPTVNLTASPENIQSGQSSTLTWSSSNANSCSALWTSSNSTSGSKSVSPSGTTTYNIACINISGQSANTSVTVSVGQVATCQDRRATNYGDPLPCVYPRINPTVSISANPSEIETGQNSIISWTSANATSCSISGLGGVSSNGAQLVSPVSTTTYKITCSGGSGTSPAIDSATVTFIPPIIIPPVEKGGSNSTVETARTVLKNPTTQNVSNIVIAVPAAVSVFLLASLLVGFPFLNYLFYLFVVVSQVLGFKKKPTPWGVVYDSYTKRPLPFARVEILNEQSRKLQSTIADMNGRYGFLIPEEIPNVKLQAYLDNYDFPSKAEPSIVEQKLYPNIYKGGMVKAISGSNLDLPMDRRGESQRNFYFGITSPKLNNILTGVANVLFILGTILGIGNAILNPSITSYSILGLILLTFIMRTSGFKLKPFGLTKDLQTNQNLPFGLITLHNEKGERTNFTVSDEKGRYFLLTPKGNYLMKAYTPSHITPGRTKELQVSAKKGWISKEIGV